MVNVYEFYTMTFSMVLFSYLIVFLEVVSLTTLNYSYMGHTWHGLSRH